MKKSKAHFSQDEINHKVQVNLQKCGCSHHIQAKFFNLLATEVQMSNNPQLFLFKSQVKDRKEIAWLLSAQIVKEYLHYLNMFLTQQTFSEENRIISKKEPNIIICLHIHQRSNAISELIRYHSRKSKFTRKEKQIINS